MESGDEQLNDIVNAYDASLTPRLREIALADMNVRSSMANELAGILRKNGIAAWPSGGSSVRIMMETEHRAARLVSGKDPRDYFPGDPTSDAL